MRRVITLFALLFIGLYSNAQDNWNAVKVFELDAEDWKEGLLRFQWYDFFSNDPFGLINHNIVYQLMKY